jgi:hypothetical protein
VTHLCLRCLQLASILLVVGEGPLKAVGLPGIVSAGVSAG